MSGHGHGHGGGGGHGGHGHGHGHGKSSASERQSLLGGPSINAPAAPPARAVWRALLSDKGRRLAVALMVVDVGSSVALLWSADGGTAAVEHAITSYDITHSVYDVAIASAARLCLLLGACLPLFSSAPTVGRAVWRVTAASLSAGCVVALFVKTALYGQTLGDEHGARLALFVTQPILAVVETIVLARSAPDVPADDKDKEIALIEFFKVLRPYFWPHGTRNKMRALSTYALVGISKGANVIAPIYIGRAMQRLHDGNENKAITPLAQYCGLLLLSSVAKNCQSIVYQNVKLAAYREIASETFCHLHALSLEWHLSKKMGTQLRSMDRGVESANTVVTYLFLYLIPTLVESAIVALLFLFKFEQWLLALVAAVSIVAYSCVTIWMTLWRKKFRAQTVKHDNTYHEIATESLVNFETVKVFTREDFEQERYTKAIDDYQSAQINTQVSLGLLNITQAAVINATIFTALAISLLAIKGGSMNVGDFVTVMAYIMQMFTPLGFLGTIYGAVIRALVEMYNLSELRAVKRDITDVPGAMVLPVGARFGSRAACVEFSDVCFDYPGSASGSGLKGVSFTIQPGTTTAVVGHTGAGKTTISRLLFRFYDLQTGCITVDGHDISQVTQRSLREAIGVVPQDTCLFNDTLRFNLSYGKLDATDDEILAACKAASLDHVIADMPLGLETVVGERGLKLSGGEKQRVAIARALLKDPPIVILDEATSALDSETEKSIQAALATLGEHRTTLVIAHRLSTIRNVEQIVVLDKGMVAEVGTFMDLSQRQHGPAIFAAMWAAQIEGTAAVAVEAVEVDAQLVHDAVLKQA